MSISRIIQLESVNQEGRDFVVGDLHGCLEMLAEALWKVGFDSARDRVFCVGDLIDRGPSSFDTLKLLKEPWFFAVRGNHEDMLLSAYDRFDSDYHSKTDFLRNGGDWVLALRPEQLHKLESELLPLVEQLPYVRTFVDAQGEVQFHVAHAELMCPPGFREEWRLNALDGSRSFLTDQDLLAWGKDPFAVPEGLYISRFQASVAWGRRLFSELRGEVTVRRLVPADPQLCGLESVLVTPTPLAPQLSLTFVGHTPIAEPVLHHSHLFIDGAAFRRANGQGDGRLHLLDIKEARQILSSALSITPP